MKQITIFLDQYTQKNGGSATSIELGEALTQHGHHVTFLTNFFTVKSIGTNLSRPIYPATFMDVPSKLSVKRVVKEIIKAVYLPRVRTILRTSDYIIVPFISPRRLEYVRGLTTARIIFNHAASVDMMRGFVSRRGLDYAHYTQLFDRVMFQSGDDCASSGLPNGVTLRPSFWKAKTEYLTPSSVLSDRNINIVWVGSLQARKRPDLALSILAELLTRKPHYKLTMVGPQYDAAYAASIRRQAAALPAGRVDILGFRSDYLKFINEADVVLQTSEFEGVSRILRESFYLARVVATFRIQGTSEICNSSNSLLADFGATGELAALIDDALSDLATIARLREAGRATYDAQYSWDRYVVSAAKIFA